MFTLAYQSFDYIPDNYEKRNMRPEQDLLGDIEKQSSVIQNKNELDTFIACNNTLKCIEKPEQTYFKTLEFKFFEYLLGTKISTVL